MNKSEQINELATALSAAQGEMENAGKNAANPHFKSKYADLAEVVNTVRPVFSKHGLAVTQCPSYENGTVSVETILLHKSGQWISSTISAPVSKQDAQGVGSAITYCRRYSLAAVAGLAQEDDDAETAIGRGSEHHHPTPTQTAGKPITAAQVGLLKKKMEHKRIFDAEFCEYFKISKVEDLPFSLMNDALKALDQDEIKPKG